MLALAYADRRPVLIDKSESLLNAARYMFAKNRYHAVVVDGEMRLAGVLSMRDVARAVFVVGEEAVELVEAGTLARVLLNPVYMYATRDVVYVGPGSRLVDALDLMISRNIGSLPIVGDDLRVVGVLEERYAIKAMPSHTTRSLCDYVTWDLLAMDADDDVLEAVGMMMQRGVRRVVVTEGDRVLGLVTLNVLVDYVLSPTSLERLLSGDNTPLFRPLRRITVKPWFVDCSYTLREVASILTSDPLGAALVEGEEGRLGILTERDCVRALRDSLLSS